MPEIQLFSKLILAAALGGLLGLEVETRTSTGDLKQEQELKRRTLGGVRTYSLIAFLGGVASLFYAADLAPISYLIFIALIIILAVAYGINAYVNKGFGITGEFSLLLSALVGFMAVSNLVQTPILVGLVLLLTFVLSQKQGIATFANSLAHNELQDVLKFGIMLLIIAPFLPNIDVSLGSLITVPPNLAGLILFNPAKLWQYVVIISGLSIVGYFAIKILGQKVGALASGVFSGLVSSTGAVIAFATKSKQGNNLQPWVSSALIAHAVSFVQFAILSYSISAGFLTTLLPLVLTFGLSSLVIGLYGALRLKSSQQNTSQVMEKRAVFLLQDAVQFALLVVFFRFLVQFITLVFGPAAGVFTIILSGFTGMDVALVTMGDQWLLGLLPTELLLIVFVLTNLVNFAAKVFYGRVYGVKGYSNYLAKALAVSALLGGAVLMATLISL